MASREKWCIKSPTSIWRAQEQRRHIGVSGGRRFGNVVVPLCSPDHGKANWAQNKRVDAWPLCGTCVKIAGRIARQAKDGAGRD